MDDNMRAWGDLSADTYRQMLARRGLTPETAPEPEPLPEPDPFTENARAALAFAIPARFADARPDHPQVAEWVRRFNDTPRSAPSMLLFGPTGTGKTWQMLGALRAVVEYAAANRRTVRHRMTTHPDLNDALRPKRDDSDEDALDPYLACDLLLLDDVGTGRQTDWTSDALYRLVNARWFRSLPTIYSTNLSLADLSAAVGERIVSRMFDGVRVAMTGADRRRSVGGAR